MTAKERAGWVEPRWEEWLQLSLLLPKDDGSNLEIEILRPEWWVVQQFQFHYEEAGLASDSSGTSTDEIPFAIRRSDNPSESFAAGCLGDLEQYFSEANSAEADAVAAAISCQLTPLRPAYYELAMAGLLAEASGLELVGATVEMDLHELGAVGPALVVDLKPCPTVPAGPGQVITATFKHASADVMDLVLSHSPINRTDAAPIPTALSRSPSTLHASPATPDSSLHEAIGVTGNHPFWSVDRAEFVQAGELAIGERLQTLGGDIRWVQQKLPRPGPEPVYNLEVHGEHVYYVGDSGVLAHNASCWDDYEKRVQNVYGGAGAFVSRTFYGVINGKIFKGVADLITKVGSKLVAIEAKYVKNWAKSIRNPASKIGSKSFALKEQAKMLEQAKRYSKEFDEVIYHSNSQALIDHYSKVFRDAGLNNIRFVLTP